MTLERLPNVSATPTYFLHKLLESIGEIDSIVAVVKWNNKVYQCCWTAQDLSSLAMSSVCAQTVLAAAICEPDE